MYALILSSEYIMSATVVPYTYLEKNLSWTAPCAPSDPTAPSSVQVYLYIYKMDHVFVEGPDSIPKMARSDDAFLPAYNRLYPYLKVYTNTKGKSLSFPVFTYDCVVDSESGNTRFENQCLSAFLALHPEWESYYTSHTHAMKHLLRGSVDVNVNKERVICVIIDASSAPSIESKWMCMDELIYSPKIWNPVPVVTELFKQHGMLRHIMIQTATKTWQVAPFPLVVYSSEPSFLPQLDDTWGWVYKYTSVPQPNSRRHLAFLSNVYYNINPETSETQQKEFWEKSGFMYLYTKASTFTLLAERPRVEWISRDPLPLVG